VIRLPENALNAQVVTNYHRTSDLPPACELCPDAFVWPGNIEVTSTDFTGRCVCEAHQDDAVRLAIQTAWEAGDAHPKVNVEVSIPAGPGVEVGETDTRAAA
jgi:hypothetical protein